MIKPSLVGMPEAAVRLDERGEGLGHIAVLFF
jgi:hypothetical protein